MSPNILFLYCRPRGKPNTCRAVRLLGTTLFGDYWESYLQGIPSPTISERTQLLNMNPKDSLTSESLEHSLQGHAEILNLPIRNKSFLLRHFCLASVHVCVCGFFFFFLREGEGYMMKFNPFHLWNLSQK